MAEKTKAAVGTRHVDYGRGIREWAAAFVEGVVCKCGLRAWFGHVLNPPYNFKKLTEKPSGGGM